MATYDMTTLGDDRSPIRIHIVNEVNNIEDMRTISISTEATLAELQFEVDRTLGIKEEHQSKFKVDALEMTSPERKLSGYGIDKNTTLTLYLSDDCDYTPMPTSTAPENTNTAPLDVVVQPTAAAAGSGGPVGVTAVSLEQPASDDSLVHYLTKHSKIQLYAVLALVHSHESVYGSTGLYVGLLTIELVLNLLWLYWYWKFFYAVLRCSEATRDAAGKITALQPILI